MCDENVGVVGRDLTEVPNATVGVVARGGKALGRRLEPDEEDDDDAGVGVLRPEMFEEELLRRLERFRLPVDPRSYREKDVSHCFISVETHKHYTIFKMLILMK